jgi:cytochrome c oxidase subunit 2
MKESLTQWFQTQVLHLPKLASEHGRNLDNLLTYVHWLMLALFVGWLGYFIFVLIRFRASRHPTGSYAGVRSHFTNYLEGGVALIETFLLVGFSVPLWATMVSNPPAKDQSTEVWVMGRQFNWMAHYAGPDGKAGRQDAALANGMDPFGLDRKGDTDAKDDVVVQGNILVPVGKPVLFHVSSLDVIHSLAIPSMRICQDAIPGMSIPVWFTPTEVGEFRITCAQLCGNSHYGMFGTLKVVAQPEYDKWLTEQGGKARAVADPVSYE